ncbi:hypothetical protein CC78DRAFT_537932 [Lojkania enalia]|uniref:Wbp11/ELF5/Saf1 N-terminal domain-containing protein n=1 Tax=Lojkania enalia TaxID=147567 RepID=A0A9P4JXI1_9PLEO|nr:hypothetical protein CC78DRAFT_537932 [Didymosphaeria enalia]
MPKEKNYNPVQAAKKAEKAKQLRKQKATVQAQRNEKLARRNPSRIQRDIESLKGLEQTGDIRPHERQRLAQLEKDLAAVNKAREALGDRAPQFRPERRGDDGGGGGRGRGGGILGKRGRDRRRKSDGEESSDTDKDVKDIPMPRDTPPPIPRRKRGPQDEPEPPPEPKRAQIVYEAAPQVRNLRKEAARFIPVAVAQKMRLAKGQVEGKLLEPDEYGKLEKEGYMKTGGLENAADYELEELLGGAVEEAVEEAQHHMMVAEAEGEINNLKSEDNVAERKLHQVELEEVADEDL